MQHYKKSKKKLTLNFNFFFYNFTKQFIMSKFIDKQIFCLRKKLNFFLTTAFVDNFFFAFSNSALISVGLIDKIT